MYSFPHWESVHCPMSSSNCCFLTCIQISQEAGKVVWYFHLLKIFPQFVVVHAVKSFSVVNEAEINGFLEFSRFFYDSTDVVDNLICGSFAFSKFNLHIWKFSVHILFKPSLKYFEHYFASIWNEYICVLHWDWDENWPFPVLWPLLSFSNLLAYWVQQFHSIIF